MSKARHRNGIKISIKCHRPEANPIMVKTIKCIAIISQKVPVSTCLNRFFIKFPVNNYPTFSLTPLMR